MATKPVIVGVDGSEESLLAVEWAALEARRHSSPLRIVSAPDVMPRMHAYQASPAEIAAALRGISARALDAAITRSEEVAPGLAVDTGLLSGPPAVAVAESGSGASMLVVGARGGRVRGDDARLGEPVRRHLGPLPGRGGPGGDHGRAPRDRGGRPRSGGGHRGAGVRVRGGGTARRGPGRRAHLVPASLGPGRRAASGRPRAVRRRGGPASGRRARGLAGQVPGRAGPPRTSSVATLAACSPATPPAPIWWCSAGTAIPRARVRASARSSTPSSTTPTAPSPSSPRVTDTGRQMS